MPYRPGLTPYEQVQANNQRLSLDVSYFLEQNVSIYSDIALTIRQELFRRGIEWKQKFACKCVTCGAEHEELVPKCETCGSLVLAKPEPGQKLNFNHADGSTFFNQCNRQGQTLKDVLEEFEFHLEVADRGILLLLKYYGLDDEGNVTATVPLEVMTLDPRFTTLLYDTVSGLPGGKGKICLAHRGELQGQDKEVCQKCGKKLYDAIAKTEYPAHSEYYVDGEVFWTSKYFPKFGYPPVFKIIDDAWAYHFLEKRVRNYYEKGRAPAILEVPSNNIPSVTKMMNDMAAMLQQDSDYFPWVATDPASHKGLTVVNLMNDPTPEMLEVKADIRQRFGSFFGVMPLFQGDVAGVGGLNNESRQLEVSNRAFARGQSIYHDKVFPWLVQMGQGRGGFYSVEAIENGIFELDIHNADRILPEYQELRVGDRVSLGRGVFARVAVIEPLKHLILRATAHGDEHEEGALPLKKGETLNMTWAFFTETLENGDRRLVLIGLAAGSGLEDVAGLQLDAAVEMGELDVDDLRYLVVFLAHYAGWPRAAALNSQVETLIARAEKAAASTAATPADTDAGAP